MYYQFHDADGREYGSFEIWFHPGGEGFDAGWYWATCWPGCLPDGDPLGPFDSRSDALADAWGE